MNKLLLIIITAIILSACSFQPNTQQAVTNSQAEMTTIPVDPMQDLIISGIKTNFNNGGHANKLTCEQCHIDTTEALSGKLTWTDIATGQVKTISKPTELCVKCHEDQKANTSQVGTNLLAHSDFECTGCHNPHNLQASCAGSFCHFEIQITINSQIKKPENHQSEGDPNSHMCGGTNCHEMFKQVANAPAYHQPVHRNVPCQVCHDESGLSIALTANQTWITTDNPQQAINSVSSQVTSHAIGTDVDCSKCHSINNIWKLMVILPSDQK
jgi:hypothetical protein